MRVIEGQMNVCNCPRIPQTPAAMMGNILIGWVLGRREGEGGEQQVLTTRQTMTLVQGSTTGTCVISIDSIDERIVTVSDEASVCQSQRLV